MKNIKLLFITLLVFLLIPTNIYAESYELESNTDSNSNHFYLPEYIPLPVSSKVSVINQETENYNYLTDFNDKSWSLYTVTLEVITDGTEEAFDDLKNKINNSPYDSLSYSTLTNTSDTSYTINNKSYTPETDTLLLAMGEELSIKTLNGSSYDEGESSGWPIFIQYSLNRYKSIDELNECIDTNDSNELNMRRGLVQISIFYPSDQSIDSYFKVSDGTNVYEDDPLDNLDNNIGDNYDVEVNDDNTTSIKDKEGNELATLDKDSNDQISITIKDKTLTDEDINELLIDIAASLINTNETLDIKVNDKGQYVISDDNGKELLTIVENNGKYVVNINNSNNDSNVIDTNTTSNETVNEASNSKSAITPIVEAIVLIIIIVVLGTVIVKSTFKKKK